MNCFGGRLVVFAAVSMMLSVSALAQDRCCRQVSKKCHQPEEMRRCVNYDAVCFSTVATCAPAATCCQPAATCCRPSATTCYSEAVNSNPAVGVAPITDQLLRSLQQQNYQLPRQHYYLGDHPPYWGGSFRGYSGR